MTAHSNHYDVVWRAPVGMLGISVENDQLLMLDYMSPRSKPRSSANAFAKEVLAQVKAYFSDPSHKFDLPLVKQGSEHQQRVWRALQKIPSGKTMSYGVLADRIASGARAVGNACRHNPVSIVVPCHRVVAANGPGGYGGAVNGAILQRKLWLLEHEGAH